VRGAVALPGGAPGRLAGAAATGLAAAALLAGALLLAPALARVRPAPPDEKLWGPPGPFLRESAVGFREASADWLWFRTVQYYGEYRQGRHDLAYFRGLLRAVTTLDPRFTEAQRFGALVLATDMGDVEGGAEVLREGILANPDCAMLPFEVGFLRYVLQRDYARAAVWFEAAARAPDASDFQRRFAAFAHKRAGQLEVSYALWRNLRDTSASPEMRDLGARMMTKIEDALRARDAARPAPAGPRGAAAPGARGGRP
jgi:hypothetical protein